jgi:hypothetical protein
MPLMRREKRGPRTPGPSARKPEESLTSNERSRGEAEMYARINHLTINEEVEVYELCEENGTVLDFGTEEEMLDALERERFTCSVFTDFFEGD